MKKNILASLLFLCAASGAAEKPTKQIVKIQVTDAGFVPAQIKVTPGSHVILKVTRTTDETCAKEILIKEKKINEKLAKDKEVTIDLGTLKNGDIRFACGMNMISGHIIVE